MNQIKNVLNFHFLAFSILSSISCNEAETIEDKKNLSSETKLFNFRVGKNIIRAELAILPKEREKGLMFRDKIKMGSGMLFVFKHPTPQKFWMKNTRIPLDIGYFDENGILKEVHAAKPFDKSGIPSKSKKIQIVLELNLNDFRSQGIKIGDRINFEGIRKAITERGLDPNDYLKL